MRVKELLKQFSNDYKKIVFPSKRDVIYFSIMSVALAGAFALFFILADKIASSLVNYLLSA